MKLEGTRPPEQGKAIRVTVDGTAVAVFNLEGKLFGVAARCPHAGGPLEQGHLEDGAVRCPWHGSVFDLATGAVRRGPAIKPVRSYAVREEDGVLVVEPR